VRRGTARQWTILAMSISTVLLVLALIAFVLAAAGWKWRKTEMVAIGLALWSLADLVNHLSSLTISSLILLLAFIAFVAAAAGWRYRKLNLISVGLALWVLSLLISSFVH
jgi:Na+/melibiose symporter-like transporter